MNNPINTPQSPNDLVLRLIGGERDGQLFTVPNEKCLLSDLSPGIENAENYRCVIFRGEKGVAFRSYSDHVLCNGAKVSVQWLKKGDLIKLTDNFSVEVYQLGVYTKKTAATPTASRQPVNTVELPAKVNPASSLKAPVVARPETTTVATSSPAPVAPPAGSPAAVPPLKDYAKPSVQFPSVSSSPAGEAPKFKPATANLRTPSVTAPLPTHQIPTEAPTPAPAPAPSVSRMPVVTQALDIAASATDSLPKNEAENRSVNTQSSPEAPAVNTSVGIPSTPSNATIDSLSERLSKLVDSAGETGESEFVGSAPTNTPLSPRPSVSTMPIQPTAIELAKEPAATSEALAHPSPVVVQPDQPSVSTPSAGRTPAPTIVNSPAPPMIGRTPAPTIVNSPAAPTAEVADSGSPTAASPQPEAADSAAQRRAALENYFSKSGISLSDSATPAEEKGAPVDPVSQQTVSVEPEAPTTPSAVVEPPVAPAAPAREIMATEAISISPPTAPSKEPVANEATASSPAFDLDSVLANLESGSTTSASQSPSVEPPQVQQLPVAAAPVAETPVVQTPVVQTPVVENTFEQPPIETEEKGEPSSEAPKDGQGSQLESFALLQSLGLDTSGLGQIKKELAEAPLREEIESISLNTEQQAEPEASEPETVESVADVLARMQNTGSLQDFNAGEAEAESSSADIAQPAAPTPPPTSSPVPPTESSPTSAELGSGAVAGSGGEDDGSVEDYMSQLLNRMRGDGEPTSGEVAEQKQDKAVEKIAAEQQLPVSAAAAESAKEKKLTPEEFVPKQKAVRMQSLDSLREIANSNAREAFRDSLARERKVSTQTKLTLSLVSLGFAVLFFFMSYMKDQVNFWGVVFGIGFLIIGLLTARAYLSERKLDESILSD